jgi:hypothetical protein
MRKILTEGCLNSLPIGIDLISKAEEVWMGLLAHWICFMSIQNLRCFNAALFSEQKDQLFSHPVILSHIRMCLHVADNVTLR